MAIENKPASAYAKNGASVADGMSAVVKKGNKMDELKISVGGISKSQMNEVKTSGIAQRGHGAATNGFISRGPMG